MRNKNCLARGCAFLTAFASIGLTGCASIVGGTNKIVSVEARQSDRVRLVPGAACELSNDKGVYYVTTPGTVTVSRAYGPLIVKCEKENFRPGISHVPSTTKGMAFGNILIGGIIGIGVDAATGAAYDYPNAIRVIMGERLVIPASDSGIFPASLTVDRPTAQK